MNCLITQRNILLLASRIEIAMNHQPLTNANFQLGRFADIQVFPIFVLALTGDKIDASNSQP